MSRGLGEEQRPEFFDEFFSKFNVEKALKKLEIGADSM